MTEAIPRLRPSEVWPLLQAGQAVLVDLRDRERYDDSHIRGARPMPWGELATRFGELPADKTIVLYATGAESDQVEEAARLLRARGLRQVAILDGGFHAWVAAGLPTAGER